MIHHNNEEEDGWICHPGYCDRPAIEQYGLCENCDAMAKDALALYRGHRAAGLQWRDGRWQGEEETNQPNDHGWWHCQCGRTCIPNVEENCPRCGTSKEDQKT